MENPKLVTIPDMFLIPCREIVVIHPRPNPSRSTSVGFPILGDRIESVVEVGLVRAGRLRQSVLRSAFEGRL